MQRKRERVCVVEWEEFGVQLLLLNSARQHHRTFWIELGTAGGTCAQARKRLAASTARRAASLPGNSPSLAQTQSRILNPDLRFQNPPASWRRPRSSRGPARLARLQAATRSRSRRAPAKRKAAVGLAANIVSSAALCRQTPCGVEIRCLLHFSCLRQASQVHSLTVCKPLFRELPSLSRGAAPPARIEGLSPMPCRCVLHKLVLRLSRLSPPAHACRPSRFCLVDPIKTQGRPRRGFTVSWAQPAS